MNRTLLLGNVELPISSEREKFVEFRYQYNEIGSNHKKAFLAGYARLATVDELFQRFPELVEATLADVATRIASDLAANGVFDVGVKAIRLELEARAETVATDFKKLQDRYVEIIGKSAELEAQRKTATENRGRVIGGGFGVEGAARGMALAAVANSVVGLAHGLANLTAKAASELGDKKKKQEIFNDPKTKTTLGDFLVRIALQGSELVAAHVNNSSDKAVFDVVTDVAQEKSVAMVENVAAGRVPTPEIQSILIQALSLNPFNDSAWQEWLERFGDPDGSVEDSASHLHIDTVSAHKLALMAKRRDQLSWGTPEACRESAGALEPHAAWLGVPFDEERGRIEAKAQELDRRRRTFGGVLYQTQGEAEAAQAENDRQQAAQRELDQRTVEGITYATQQEADEAELEHNLLHTKGARAESVIGWSTLAIRRVLQYSGRSCRKEFLAFLIFGTIAWPILCLAAVIIVQYNGYIADGELIIYFVSLLLMTFFVPLVVRRLHDFGYSGLIVLVGIIPFVRIFAAIALVIALLAWEGNLGTNEYGLDPDFLTKKARRAN